MTNGVAPIPQPRTIAIIGVVNADDPSLPITGGGRMAIHLRNPSQAGLSVLLNDVDASLTTGFDADGRAALIISLTAAPQSETYVGPLTVKILKRGPDGKAIVAESSTFKVDIIPGFADPAAIDDAPHQIIFSMALPVLPRSSATALFYPQGETTPLRVACLPRRNVTNRLSAPLGGISPGNYLIVIEIDGFASLLDWQDGEYVGPLVRIPEFQ